LEDAAMFETNQLTSRGTLLVKQCSPKTTNINVNKTSVFIQICAGDVTNDSYKKAKIN
jgi:hypothetical protein